MAKSAENQAARRASKYNNRGIETAEKKKKKKEGVIDQSWDGWCNAVR